MPARPAAPACPPTTTSPPPWPPNATPPTRPTWPPSPPAWSWRPAGSAATASTATSTTSSTTAPSRPSRARLGQDQATEYLSRLLRTVEQAGADPRQVLADAVRNGASLAKSNSAAQVLGHRITRGRPDQALLDHPHLVDGRPDAGIPADIPTADADTLRALHDQAATRTAQLGALTAQTAPDWAVLALGPVPDTANVEDRADWERRAGIAAAHREAVGYDHPTRALDRLPGLSAPERRASYAAAWQALGRPESELDETAMTEGQLLTRIAAWQREKQWEPPYVDDQLHAAETALETARQTAALAEAQADQADRAADHARAEALRAAAEQLRGDVAVQAAVVDQLTKAASTRTNWLKATAVTRTNHDRALAEADRRGLDLTPNDALTADDWLIQHQAENRADDAHRPITEHDLAHEHLEADQTLGAQAATADVDGAPTAGDETPPASEAADAADTETTEAAGADSADEPERPGYSRIGLDVTLSTAGLAAARLADQASQDAAHEAAEAEQFAADAADAGRRRRELADLDYLAADTSTAAEAVADA
jgi:hypothetical protein